MDIDLLIDFVSTLPCPNCSSPCFGCAHDTTKVQVNESLNDIASCLVFTSSSCSHQHDFHTSKKVDTGVSETNRRFPLAITSIDSLLSKCTHGGTQNTIESFHNLVWERCPKTAFVVRRRLELAIYEATIVYNEGEMARMPVFSKLGFQPGCYTASGLKELDEKRVARAYVAGSATVLAQRQPRSVQSSSQRDDPAYISGGF